MQKVCPYLTFFFQLMTYMTTLKLFSGGNETKHWQQKIQNSTFFIISFVPTARKGPTKRQTKKVPLPRVLKVPKALIAKKAVKVREVGIIAAAARLVSVMKRKLNRRAALIQGKLRGSFRGGNWRWVTGRQNTNCIDRFDGRTGNNQKNLHSERKHSIQNRTLYCLKNDASLFRFFFGLVFCRFYSCSYYLILALFH